MTTADSGAFPSFERSRRRARPQWRRALRALRRLMRDPDRTENAFEVIAALDPDLMERGLARMLAHPEGRRMFLERPCLLDRLRDREALARLPDGSFGRAYLAHIERYGLDPGKLVALGRSYEREISSDDEGMRCTEAPRDSPRAGRVDRSAPDATAIPAPLRARCEAPRQSSRARCRVRRTRRS